MGVGWSSNYGVRLRAASSEDLVFTDPFGFTSNFVGGYNPPTTDEMNRLSLKRLPPWIVTDGTTTWTLGDTSGDLLRVEAAGGASAEIHYDG